MRSDEMFGLPTHLGLEKQFVFKKVIFGIFGRFPMSDCIQKQIEDFEIFAVFSIHKII